MRRRRPFLSLLLLVLAVLAPATRAACAPAPAAASEHAHHHGHDAPVQDVATHCATVAGCGAVLALVEAPAPASTVAVVRDVATATPALPSSPRAAPEPPPPRG
ncbi:hypothetical protein [Roseisolibacter sp. H3M3-2]|uniref:hypothetical protein n=1 Tax=Roseisolibacter sp. H3M3-2 TaxID=3031323 RepID=UPI0023DB6125|nr:hypothetical protein [Roseisolibacter sp. H3M3-2]MDF1504115.1 hypothetical protein [Roseisolibacter sp. H3M3-2]